VQTYFDFAAKTEWEREVIVSTILVLLDSSFFKEEEWKEEFDVQNNGNSLDLPSLPQEGCNNNDAAGVMLAPRRPSDSSRPNVIRPEPKDRYESVESHDVLFIPDFASPENGRRSVESVPDDATIPNALNAMARNTALWKDDASVAWGNSLCESLLQDLVNMCGTETLNETVEAWNPVPEICTGVSEGMDPRLALAQFTLMQDHIFELLGGDTSFFAFEGSIWEFEKNTQGCKQAKKIKLRNRATVLNAQALRLRRLREDMTFRGATVQKRKKMHHVQITQSLDEGYHISDPDRVSAGPGNYTGTSEEGVSVLHAEHRLDDNIFSLFGQAPAAVEEEENEKYYDSDPGDAKPRYFRRASRSAVANVIDANDIDDDADDDDDASEDDSTRSPIARRKDRPIIIPADVNGEQAEELIQETFSGTSTCLWHPTQDPDNTNRAPVLVFLWMERGSRVQSTFIQPKLMWRPRSERELHRRRLGVSATKPEAVDLLDICRILVPKRIDREIHPFAKPDKSFEIETTEDSFLFQAETVAQRDRLVHGLKLVVARLASRLIVGDRHVYREFFTPFTDRVPGQAPKWSVSQSESWTSENDAHIEPSIETPIEASMRS